MVRCALCKDTTSETLCQGVSADFPYFIEKVRGSARPLLREHANMRTRANTPCSRVRAESCHRLRKRVLNHRIIACCGRRTTAVFARGVLCTFWPQKVPKALRRMPLPMPSRLTLAPGARLKGGFKGRWAAERVISDTTLSLLKPASYAGTFSRDFVSRLRHRAGIVRRVPRREGCVRDKQEAQKPTIAPGSGFKPPHYRLQRNENNRQPACPEREAGKGVRRRGQTACCLPSRHSLYGACFCAVKA